MDERTDQNASWAVHAETTVQKIPTLLTGSSIMIHRFDDTDEQMMINWS